MSNTTHSRILFGASSLLLPALGHAQSIAYAPSTSIPTLSEWGALLLAAAVAVAGIVMARRMGSKTVMALALGAAAVLAGGTSSLLSRAYAVAAEHMLTDAGGTIDLTGYGEGYDIRIYGHPTISMRILSVTPPSAPTTLTPTCTAGLVLPPAPYADASPSSPDYSGGVCYYRKSGGMM